MKGKIQKMPALLLAALCMAMLCGCRIVRVEEGPVTPVAYRVVPPEEIPPEVRELMEERKEKEFRLSYFSGNDRYLIRGYGKQISGGYSISVEELGIMGNVLKFRTKLTGPSEEEKTEEPSYPCIVVKVQDRKEPVRFYG